MPSRTKKKPPVRRRAARPPVRKRRLGWPIVLGGSAVVVLAVVALLKLGTSSGGGGPGHELAAQIDQSATSLSSQRQDGLALGSADAPLTLEIFEDFQCPYCITFTATMEPVIVDEFVAGGKVRLVFRNYPILGFESELAARASVCAGEQGRGWDLGLALFSLQASAGQVEREQLNVGRLTLKKLLDVGASVGVDRAKLNACMVTPVAADAVVEQFTRGQSLGIRGTPAFALNGVVLTNPPNNAEGWRTLLNSRLATPTQTGATR